MFFYNSLYIQFNEILIDSDGIITVPQPIAE